MASIQYKYRCLMRRFTSNLFAFSTITHIRGSITSPTQSPSLLTLAASNSAACTSAPLQLTVLISSFSQRRSTRLRTGSASSAILITKYPTTHLDHPPAQHLHPLPSKLRQLRPLRALRMVRRSLFFAKHPRAYWPHRFVHAPRQPKAYTTKYYKYCGCPCSLLATLSRIRPLISPLAHLL